MITMQEHDRVTLTVEEAAKALGIGRGLAYEAVGRGEIPTVRIGRRLLVPRAALQRLLAGEDGSGRTRYGPDATSEGGDLRTA